MYSEDRRPSGQLPYVSELVEGSPRPAAVAQTGNARAPKVQPKRPPVTRKMAESRRVG